MNNLEDQNLVISPSRVFLSLKRILHYVSFNVFKTMGVWLAFWLINLQGGLKSFVVFEVLLAVRNHNYTFALVYSCVIVFFLFKLSDVCHPRRGRTDIVQKLCNTDRS